MAKYNLTKSYTEIAETYGLFQNVTGNADIEITDDVNDSGIVLKPFQTVAIHQKVFARKIGIAGNCVLMVLPFAEQNLDNGAESTDESQSLTIPNFEVYDDLFATHHNFGKPPPHFPPPLSVRETQSHYIVKVSKESLNHQKKFLLQFEDKGKEV